MSPFERPDQFAQSLLVLGFLFGHRRIFVIDRNAGIPDVPAHTSPFLVSSANLFFPKMNLNHGFGLGALAQDNQLRPQC